MAGLTPEGFDKKTDDQCLQETKTDIWSTVSAKMNLSSVAPFGQILGIVAEREALLWDALEAIHAARDPNAATGSSLRAVSKLTGTEAQSATPTLVPGCILSLESGFSAAAGTMFAALDTDPTARFTNRNDVSNPAGDTEDVVADFVAETPGAQPALAGHLVVISESLAGWLSVTNPVDGAVGLDDDNDVTLRARRDAELQTNGSTTADAIRSDVLKFLQSNITSCKVIPNDTDTVDENGIPQKSFEVIARGQSQDDNSSIALATQILASKCGGDRAFGDDSRVILDDQGNSHVIGFTWVADRNVYLVVSVKTNPATFPADGDTQIKNAIVAIAFGPGDEVVAELIKSKCFAVTGVNDVPSLALDFSSSPTATSNLTIGVKEQAKLDTSRITVTHV